MKEGSCLDFLTLQDKHNICTLPVKQSKNIIREVPVIFYFSIYFLQNYPERAQHRHALIMSPKLCFCSVSYYYYYYYYDYSLSLSPFFPRTMNLSTADLRNYWTEFHETLWSYRYMFLIGPKVFRIVVKGVKVIFWGVQREWGLL